MPLKTSDGIGTWIKDFKKSKAPQFKGKSKEKRRQQAIAAYLSAKDGGRNEEKMKTFSELREEVELHEAVKPNDVLVKKMKDDRDPSKQHPTIMFEPRSVLRALRKIVSPEAKKALAGSYMDGTAVVHDRSSKTIARMGLNMKLSGLATEVEKWTKANMKTKAVAGDIKRENDTRAIITIDDKMATQLKKSIHNPRTKTKVRIMKRKDGAKVYIDTNDKANLDAALKKASAMIKGK